MLVARNDPGVPTSSYHFAATGIVTVETTGQYIVSLVEVSPCRLLLDGQMVVDGASTIPARGQSFFGMGSVELTAIVDLVAGQPHELVLECDASNKQWAHGAQVGLQFVEQEDPVRRAVELAAECDIALVVVGTTDDWESEGHDRDTLELPGRQVELIRAVAEANKKKEPLADLADHGVIDLDAGALDALKDNSHARRVAEAGRKKKLRRECALGGGRLESCARWLDRSSKSRGLGPFQGAARRSFGANQACLTGAESLP
jgi:hypothetical protein